MTWLVDLPAAGTDWQRITGVAPAAFERASALYRAGWQVADPVLLELCRLRVAALFGDRRASGFRSGAALDAGLTEDKVAALDAWRTAAVFSERERACLAFAEQFVADAKRVTDDLVDALLAHLTPRQCYAFVRALWAVEATLRLGLVLDVDPDPDALGLVRHVAAAGDQAS